MTAVENKIPDVSHVVKKTYLETKILDIESKYFTTADFNKFTSQHLMQRLRKDWFINLLFRDS